MSKSDINNTSIAVIGIGCMFPDSKNSNQYWSLIKNKEDAIRAIPGSHWKQEDYFDPDPKKTGYDLWENRRLSETGRL